MNRFANITSITLLSLGLSMAGVGCLAASPDDETTAEAQDADSGGTTPQPPSATPSSGGWIWTPGSAYLPSSSGTSTPPSSGYPAPVNGGYASPPSTTLPPASAYHPPPLMAWPNNWNWTPPPPPSTPHPIYPPPCSGYGPFPVGGCN